MTCGGCGKGIVGKVAHGAAGLAKAAIGVDKVAHGAAGLAKAAIGVDKPDGLMIDLRLRTCRACDQLGRQFYCKVCKCIVAAKVRLMSEECPLKKWPAPEKVEAMAQAQRRPPHAVRSRRGSRNGR